MRPKDFLSLVKQQATYQADTLVERDIPPPKGWLTVEQIRQELKLSHARNASSRACDLARRGLLERQPHQFKAKTGQCHKAYVYRPLPPYRSVKEAAERLSRHDQDKVPKGWARIVDLAVELRVSDVAVRGRVARAGLKPRYFKTSRGIIGLHRNAYYLKSAVLALYR
jgi:predicted DNA-binding transcriptional regulator